MVFNLFLFMHGIWAWLLFLPVTDELLGVQENKEGLELLKSAIAKAGYTGKVSFLPSYQNSVYGALAFQMFSFKGL